MESSPAKRRKTSPTTSVPVNAPSTPSRIPVLSQGAQILPSRPSYASPTKASLARHNPQLLTRPSSAGPGAERPGSRGNTQDAATEPTSIAQANTNEQSGGESESLGSTTQGSNDLPASAETPAPITQPTTQRRSTRSTRGDLSAKPKRMSHTSAKQTEKADESIESASGEKQAGAELEEPSNPFQKAGLRRSPVISHAVAPVEPSTSRPQEEPELPPTPTQRGLDDPVVTTPPTGIHDTPSKQPRRSKALAEKLKSSPLKLRAEPPMGRKSLKKHRG
jgi:hypothetical protein